METHHGYDTCTHTTARNKLLFLKRRNNGTIKQHHNGRHDPDGDNSSKQYSSRQSVRRAKNGNRRNKVRSTGILCNQKDSI